MEIIPWIEGAAAPPFFGPRKENRFDRNLILRHNSHSRYA